MPIRRLIMLSLVTSTAPNFEVSCLVTKARNQMNEKSENEEGFSELVIYIC